MKGDKSKPCKSSLMRCIIATRDMVFKWKRKKVNHPYEKKESRRWRRRQDKIIVEREKDES